MKATLYLLSLAVSAQAYVVNVYDQPNCQGNMQQRNVYDSTCATFGDFGIESFQWIDYGSNGQVLYAYASDSCDVAKKTYGPSCAGNNNSGLNPGGCYNTDLGPGSTHALGSFAIDGGSPGNC